MYLLAQRNDYLQICRPFIVLNKCHLNDQFSGVLLSVIALNANSNILSIVVCICEGKNADVWKWFSLVI